MAAVRVLVVDDDESIRQIVRMCLGDEGYEVFEAANGLDALALLPDCRPDLILLDLRMPVMDGWEFARRYRFGQCLGYRCGALGHAIRQQRHTCEYGCCRSECACEQCDDGAERQRPEHDYATSARAKSWPEPAARGQVGSSPWTNRHAFVTPPVPGTGRRFSVLVASN